MNDSLSSVHASVVAQCQSLHAVRLLSARARDDARLVLSTAHRLRAALDDALARPTGFAALDKALEPHRTDLALAIAALEQMATTATTASSSSSSTTTTSVIDVQAFHADTARMVSACGTAAFVESARDLTKKIVALLERLGSAVPPDLSARLRDALKTAVTTARAGVLTPDVRHSAALLSAALDAVVAAVAPPSSSSSSSSSSSAVVVASDEALLDTLDRAESILAAAALELAPLQLVLDELLDAPADADTPVADIAVTARGVSAALNKLRQFAALTPRQIEPLVRVSCKAMALLHSQLRARPADAQLVATRRAALAAAATRFVNEARAQPAAAAQLLVVEINCSDAMLRDILRALVDEQRGGPLSPRRNTSLEQVPPSPRAVPSTPPSRAPVAAAPAPAVAVPAATPPRAVPAAVTPAETPPPRSTSPERDSIGWSSVRPGRAPTTTRSRRSRSMDAATAAAAIDAAAMSVAPAPSLRGRFLSTSASATRPLVPPCDHESGRLLNLDTELVLAADGQVKGGTLPALVARLYADDSQASYMAVFMHTFRAFVDSERLLRILQATYVGLVPAADDQEAVKMEKKRYRLRVGNAIKKLVEEVHDEGTNKALTDEFVTKFLDTVMFQTDETLALTIKLKFYQRQSIVDSRAQQFSEPPPRPLLPRTGTRASFHTIEALELARQMTLLDSELLRRIGPFELLGGAWTKPNKERNSANLLAMIAAFNARSTFVVESIVTEKQLKLRAALLRKMIAVADECRALNNFNAAFAIVAGLNSAPVHRLRKTWDQLSDKEQAAFAALGDLVSSAKSFKRYREVLHGVNPPCVPYIGVYQTDLIFIDQGNPDTLADGQLINFDKWRRTADVIRELVMYQEPYNLVAVASIQNFLSTCNSELDDKTLFAHSLEIEPRQQ